ncbi:ralBP1-associated Eps domain-containing protein 2-like, partial [Scleropages formosus]
RLVRRTKRVGDVKSGFAGVLGSAAPPSGSLRDCRPGAKRVDQPRYRRGMDQSPGSAMAAAAGTFLPLNEQEQRCYSALFTWCQADSAGTLSAARVAELFRASQLPADTLRQVMEVCGAKQQGYFGPTQFQLVLKLLSAAQSGLPVRLESIKGGRSSAGFLFTGMKNYAEDRYPAFSQHGDPRGPHFGGTTGQTQRWAEDRSALRHRENSVEKQEAQAVSRSPRNSPPASPSNFPVSAYSSQRNGGADTLLPVSAQPSTERGSAGQLFSQPPWLEAPGGAARCRQGKNVTPSQGCGRKGLYCEAILSLCEGQWCSIENRIREVEERRYAGGIECAVKGSPCRQAYSAERLVDHNAEDYPDDPWRITEEQLEYYTNQFKSLQPDLGALILDPVVVMCIISTRELSDVDRDGALTFREFCTAFHLIVARKNGFPLPESLPPSLQASLVAQDGAPPRPGKPRVEKQSSVAEMNISKHDVIEEPSQCGGSTYETKIKAELDAHILGRFKLQGRVKVKCICVEPLDRSYSSTSISDVVKKTEVPPTPPPRQQKTHSRASSLDLNKLFQHSSQGKVPRMQHFTATAEQDSQKALQQPDFADFSKFQEEEKISKQNLSCDATVGAEGSISPKTGVGLSQPLLQKPTRSKHRLESQNLDPSLSSFPAFRENSSCCVPWASTMSPTHLCRLSNRQKKEIQMAIRKNRETNAVLARLNSELQQQLKDVHQERIALESQLENLRPVAFV